MPLLSLPLQLCRPWVPNSPHGIQTGAGDRAVGDDTSGAANLNDSEVSFRLEALLQTLSIGGATRSAAEDCTIMEDTEAMSTAAGSGYGGSASGSKSRWDRQKAAAQRAQEMQKSKA